jgi:hypothetical protein
MLAPSIIIRGETLILQVIVFNYMNMDLTNVDVTFLQTKSFKKYSLNESSIEPISDMTINIPFIKSKSGKTVSFAISAIKIGYQILSIRANNSIVEDVEQKSILVKPEGINQISNIPLLIDMRNNDTFSSNIKIKFPQNVVQNSEECSIQIIGDILGQAFNNLGIYS